MRYREQRAGTAAGRWIECTWCLETEAPVHAYPVPPDGCVDIIYARATGAQVVGAMTVERRFDLPAALAPARAREIASTAQRMIARQKTA